MSLPSPAQAPICSVHPDQLSAGTCPRCGRFACGECLGDGAFCRSCIQLIGASLPKTGGRATAAKVFLWAHFGLDAVNLLAGLIAIGGFVGSDGEAILATLLAVPYLVAFIGGAIAFLMWLHRLVSNAIALGLDVHTTPAKAVGYWFIPFVNLVAPFRVMRSCISELGSFEHVQRARLNGWWGAWIVGNVLNNVSTRLAMTAPEASRMFDLLGSGVTMIGAVLAVNLVRVAEQAQAHHLGRDRA